MCALNKVKGMKLYMENDRELSKNIKTPKSILIMGLILIIVSLVIEGLFILDVKDKTTNKINMIDAEKLDAGKYACIDVSYMTEYFATYSSDEETTKWVYFVFDEDYTYMTNISGKTLEKLQPILNYTYKNKDSKEEPPEPVTICGITQTVPDKLKDLAIKSYNELYDDEIVNEENFYEQLGVYYLDTTQPPTSDLIGETIFVSIFFFIGLILVITYIKRDSTTRKTLERYASTIENIKMDALNPETVFNKKAKVYFTKEYIINFATSFEIIDYKDIVWIYPYILRTNGFVTQKSIYVVTKDKKVHIVASLPTNKKDIITYEELYNTLITKVPDALIGYTKENQEKVKELYIR